MKLDIKKITGYEKIIGTFGEWPSFHDSEALSIYLARDTGNEFPLPEMVVRLYAFRLQAAANDPARNNSLVTLRFGEIEKLKLLDFNHQNAINGITFETYYSERLLKNLFKVSFLQGFGLSLAFECATVEVVSVEPYSESHRAE